MAPGAITETPLRPRRNCQWTADDNFVIGQLLRRRACVRSYKRRKGIGYTDEIPGSHILAANTKGDEALASRILTRFLSYQLRMRDWRLLAASIEH